MNHQDMRQSAVDKFHRRIRNILIAEFGEAYHEIEWHVAHVPGSFRPWKVCVGHYQRQQWTQSATVDGAVERFHLSIKGLRETLEEERQSKPNLDDLAAELRELTRTYLGPQALDIFLRVKYRPNESPDFPWIAEVERAELPGFTDVQAVSPEALVAIFESMLSSGEVRNRLFREVET